jgi:erythromycin esterase-like protein
MNIRITLGLFAASISLPAAEIPFERTDTFPARAYELIADKRIVWFGEIHGTREAPELVLGLVKLISKHSVSPPVVALEITSLDQAAIDRYMASGDDSHLRTTYFFGTKRKDGRSSQALVRLLSDLRKEKVGAVVCFDAAAFETAHERDTAMAENLRTIAERFASAKIIVLSGSFHSNVSERSDDSDPNYRSAAYQLTQKIISLVSFELTFEGGTAWVLTDQGFGEVKVQGLRWNGTAPHYISLHLKPVRGHHGVIFTRSLTGSPPW